MGGYVTSGGLFALYMQNMFKTRTGGGGLEGVEALYHAYRDDVFRWPSAIQAKLPMQRT